MNKTTQQCSGVAVANSPCAPLVKWAGGKRLLTKKLLPLTTQFSRYFEPFLGGGALFFALQPASAVLSDNNEELINAFIQVRDNCESVIAALRRMKNSKAEYYKIRARRPRNDANRAARFLYLARLSFNGIHRMNLRGEFNVPYGGKKHLRPCDAEHLHRVRDVLLAADIRCTDFEGAVADAREGDLVYLDPPYTVAHGDNGFIKYNAKIFSWSDQVRLARIAKKLAANGCRVLVSNADHQSVRALYRGFKSVVVSRYSVMAASSCFRRQIQERIFFNGD